MPTEVLPVDNVFTGTENDDIANSTINDESFTMGTGANVINFDITNNQKAGDDIINLTPGEDLVLNFYCTNSSQVGWKRVDNTDTGTVDIQIETYAYRTYGYYKAVSVSSDEVSYVDSNNVTYYKKLTTYYLYDYENDEWVYNSSALNDYAPVQSDYSDINYGYCRVGTDGIIEYTWNHYKNDRHAEYASQNGQITSSIDTTHPNSIITIKDVGAENAANSIKLQWQYKSSNTPTTIVENFMAETYDLGTKSWQGVSTENQVLQGSFLNENFKMGYGDDVINTVGGNNKVIIYNGGHDVINLGAGADTVDGTFAQGQAQGHYEDLNTNTVATGGFKIIDGTSQDMLTLDEYGDNYFYKNDNDLVIIQNYQYNEGYTRLSKFTLADYFSNENRIKIENYSYNVSFNESDTEVYRKNSDGYISCNSSSNYTYFLDTDGEIYSRNYTSGNYVYTHVTQNSTIAYNRLGLTIDDFSENRNANGYYETAEINGKIYYSYYRDGGPYAYIYTKENGTYTQVVENKSAKFANDLGIVWENVVSIGSIVESGENTVNGTNNSEAIIATAQSTITTGNGDDIIYTTSANDTITIDGTGNKTVVIDTNSGEDTIIVSNHTGNLYLDFPNAYTYKVYKNIEEDAKDLIIERCSREYKNGAYVTNPIGKTVIKGYFDFSAAERAKIFAKNIENRTSKPIAIGTLYIEADNDAANTIYGTDYIDVITGRDEVDTIYTGKSNDTITPNKGNDIININDFGAKTINLAQGDGNDIINLSGNALQGSGDRITLNYTDGLTGISRGVDNEGNLVIYKTTVEGDDILTETTTIKDETGNDINFDGKVSFYNDQGHYATLASNTPIYQELSKTEDNTYTADEVSNLVTGGSGVDKITATGEINHVYTGAGNDEIDVTSSRLTIVYAGSGDDKITVKRGNPEHDLETVQVVAGDGDDEINVESGIASIHFGNGADIAHITGGTGGTLNFVAGEGNKTVIFDGASEALYTFNFTGYKIIYDNKFYKRNNDLIIEAKFKNSNTQTETHTIKNFFSSADCKLDNNAFINLDISGGYSPTYNWPLNSIDLIVEGQYDSERKATIFEGSVCDDIIDGTDGADIITTGDNNDTITPGKGNDTIIVNGKNDKNIYFSKGDGDDTIILADDVIFGDYDYIDLYDKDYRETPDKFAYTLDNNELTLYKIYNNNGSTITDSIKITGIKSKTEEEVAITAEEIAKDDGKLNASGLIYISGYGDFSADMPQLNKGNDNAANNMSTVEEANNVVMGGAKADTITSVGNNDAIYSGDGNDIITTSAVTSSIYAGAGNDTISVTAGTTDIYSGTGDDTIKISGGHGTINLVSGMGNDTLIFEKPTVDGAYNIKTDAGADTDCAKVGNDLIITTTKGGQKNTLTVKELFGKNQLADGSNLLINGNYLPAIPVKGEKIYNKKKVYQYSKFTGTNYGDIINGSKNIDVITTGGGRDEITAGKSNDTIKINGSGDKYINSYKYSGNDTIKLYSGVEYGNLHFTTTDAWDVNSYQIKNNNLIMYTSYFNGDTVTTSSRTITGIVSKTSTPVDVTYENIVNSEGGLNISGKIYGLGSYLLTQGNATKANSLASEAGKDNFVIGGKLADKVILNGESDIAHTGAYADKIYVKTNNYATVYAGTGNDKIYLYSANYCRLYKDKNDGNDIVYIKDSFNGYLNLNTNDEYTMKSYQVDKNNNLILYTTYVDGDKITTNSTTITGIKSKTETPAVVDYNHLWRSDGGLNVSGKLYGLSDYWFTQGSATKANSLASIKEKNNVVTGGKLADKVTLNGYNDYVYTGAYADKVYVKSTDSAHVYTGSGNDAIYLYSGYSDIYSGLGNDKITAKGGSGSIHLKAGEGKDTIEFIGEDFGTYNLYFENYNSYNNYYKSGNNLLIKAEYTNQKNKTVTETHTVANYFQNADVLENKLRLNYYNASYALSNYGLNIVGVYNKKKNATIYTGTKYNDKITGTSKVDLITLYDGGDVITPGKGNDTISIKGSGLKRIMLNNGDGNDTIGWSKSATGMVNLVINPNDILLAKKSGTSLIITRNYEYGNAVKYEKTVINGYYDANGAVIEDTANKLYVNGSIFNPEEDYERVDYTTTKISPVKNREFSVGTAKADKIVLTAENAAANGLAGNDIIYAYGGNAFVAGGYGDDSIYLKSTGDVTVYHAAGDGNDVIKFGSKTPSSLTLSLETKLFNNFDEGKLEYMIFAGKFAFSKSGNNLVAYIPVTNTTSTKTEKITLTDYFNDQVTKPANINMKLSGTNFAATVPLNAALQGEFGIWTKGVTKDNVTTYTGLDGYVNNYKYSGTGKAIINGENQTDRYIITLSATSNLAIKDKGGSDSLYLNTAAKNLRAFFNVDAASKIVVTSNKMSDNFMIFNYGSLTSSNVYKAVKGKDALGIINCDNFFENSDVNKYNKGDGYIEGAMAGNKLLTQVYNYTSGGDKNIQNINTDRWVAQVSEKVAAWLSSYSDGKYADKTAFDVVASKNTTDINAMLAVYNGVKYNTEYIT